MASPSASSSCCSSRPGASNGLRRLRCGSASRAAARMSSRVTAEAPRQAACAAAARAITMSARSPSTPKLAHTAAITSSKASSTTIEASRERAATIDVAICASSSANRAANPAGSASNAIRRRTTSARVAGSRGATASTVRPNRSSNCGRSSPSSGFMVPTSKNRAACWTENAVPLHVAGPQGGRVEQQVDQMVVQQVDLIDVQHAPVRRGQQPRLERRDAFGQRAADVQRPGQPVFGRADRQLHQPGRAHLRRWVGHVEAGQVRPVWALRVGRLWRAGEPAARDDLDRRQDRGQRTDRGRLRGPLLAPHEHPADGRRDRVENERQPHVVHGDDGAERKLDHGHSPSAGGYPRPPTATTTGR